MNDKTKLVKLIRFFLSFLIVLTPNISTASSLSAIDLSAWGYKDNSRQTYHESTCLFAFSPSGIEYRAIKSQTNSKEFGNANYRFTLTKETYPSSGEALKRVKFINQPPPSNSLISKSCNIRQAFSDENIVYFIHTDVGAFTKELNRIFKLYRQTITEK